MQAIIDGYLYDTETSTLIYTDENTKRRYYQTPHRQYFMLSKNFKITKIDVGFIKEMLGHKDIEKYMELFGEPKEA